MSGRPAIFIDKDGTLVENVPLNTDPARVRLMPLVGAGLRVLGRVGLPIFVVTNQPGLASGRISRTELMRLQRTVEHRMRDEADIAPTAWYVCEHAPDAGCHCRKPAPGLLRRAAQEHALDLRRSWMVGDILDDVEAGRRAGCTAILVDVGNETQWLRSAWREPQHRCANFLQAATLIVSRCLQEASARA